jgi:hypothetical protein
MDYLLLVNAILDILKEFKKSRLIVRCQSIMKAVGSVVAMKLFSIGE